MLAVGIAAAGLIFVISQWASAPTWVPAFSGVPLESVSAMTDKLDQAGVKYKLERGGADGAARPGARCPTGETRAAELDVDLDAHIAFCLEAMKKRAKELGL